MVGLTPIIRWGSLRLAPITFIVCLHFNSYSQVCYIPKWFRNGPIQVRHRETWLSSADGSLQLNGSYGSSGVDALGEYSYSYFEYHDKARLFRPLFKFTTFIKVYYSIDAIVFGHTFDSGAEDVATDSADGVISSFPSILVEDSPLERGYVTFEGNSKLIT